MELFWTIVFGLLFFGLLMASVALHEIGHLLPAKWFGVRVPQYFVGFGKTLWSRRLGETEYGIKAIPLGGYVRFVGMYPPSRARPGLVRAARTGAVSWPRRAGRPAQAPSARTSPAAGPEARSGASGPCGRATWPCCGSPRSPSGPTWWSRFVGTPLGADHSGRGPRGTSHGDARRLADPAKPTDR